MRREMYEPRSDHAVLQHAPLHDLDEIDDISQENIPLHPIGPDKPDQDDDDNFYADLQPAQQSADNSRFIVGPPPPPEPY